MKNNNLANRLIDLIRLINSISYVYIGDGIYQ